MAERMYTRRGPGNFVDRSDETAGPAGARSLWSAIALQALEDAVTPRNGQVRMAEARKWILSESTAVGSFLWVADILGLNPRPIRRHLLDREPGGEER